MKNDGAVEIARVVVYTKLHKLERKSERVYLRGFGAAAEFTERDLGWFAHFEGSHEAIHIGFSDPPFKPGQRIKITLEPDYAHPR